MQALSEAFKGDLAVLGISDEKPEALRTFLEKNKLTYPILLDPGSVIGKQFGLAGIPQPYNSCFPCYAAD